MANSVLDVQGLTKTIGSFVLFKDISFSIGEDRKVGLIARNGAGKSSLLNIICGDEDYDTGKIVYRKDLRVGYLPQHPEYLGDMTVMEACFSHGNELTDLIKGYTQALLNGQKDLDVWMERMDAADAWSYETRIKQVLTRLKITDLDQKVCNLSGGQLKRVAVANVLMMEPDLLVMDEPTNHLDIEMIEWLEHYLQNRNVSMLLVTHDRYFLDDVCTEILELDDKQMFSYKGNYSYYLEKRQARIDAQNSEIARANNLYRKELDWMRRMPSARGHKAKYRENNFYEIEAKAKQRMEEKRTVLEVRNTYIGNKIFEAKYISKSFGDKVILKDFYYNFSRYEKMGIVGNNGTGKSTFIKLLLGFLKPDSGSFSIGETVRFGYYSQEGMRFDTEMRVIDAVRDVAEYVDLGGGRKLSAMQLLQHFLFSPEQQHNYIYKLSGGERRRLYLCTVLMQNPNFLILDEPTNDLDIITLQILEEYLQHFKGCVIIVSHDRYFMDKVVDHLLVFHGDGEIKDFPGNYSQYREWDDCRIDKERREKELTAKGDTFPCPNQKVRLNQKRRLSYKEQKELESLSVEIDRLEQEKKVLEDELCSGTLSVDKITAISKRLPVLSQELDEKSMRWLELTEIAES
ncbi:MAG: ABC-F family ATP-binding cassette domain-containing protein [Bacteroidaceae bacterium]|nr:ABC-F family ATP-binding cassette domain-containing protein [Bacteroidaceae bacterium]